MENQKNKDGRRDFIKKMGLGGLSLAGMTLAPIEDQLAYATQNINRNSNPSDLEITDLRIAEISDVVFRTPIIRIYTNQGIVGHGDVRDGASKKYALMLKSRLLGENPCNVERLFKIIKQFGHHGRQGGGVSGVEMALWDLAGKAYGVPVYQLLGGKYRDRVRVYCDTTVSEDPQEYANRMQARIDKGYTALKMDIGINLLEGIPGTVVNAPDGDLRPWQYEHTGYNRTEHPFTRVQITEKGIDRLMEYLDVMRSQIGYEIPMGTDHWGHFGVNEAIKLARAAEPYCLAYMEDLIPWFYTDQWREITTSTTTPTQTGEDIYMLEGGFKELIDKQAVRIVHPDPNTAGGILETKRIGDYAAQNGVAFMHHHAASPVSFMGCVHSAAATEHFMWLEHHAVDNPEWEDLVTKVEKPIVQDGYVKVPETPGLGVELNEDVVEKYLIEGEELFAPTPEWDEMRSWDRLWS
ncbi:mandelate racemase/muconate lactonizing enzyme family protein [Aliifodinibius sp. S!AR15-10]|uniref:mandelate racemase/muconate lactonizing enzyme family protein n=1 Tax=Aliifodinibius sp. S!AR15-10 TaxID=2950437 RepID=UPI002855998C|nr:mandelate racemase/muconate lactonizing enzyme family protein [Aliifodinibius sp. S!AR15-10]MDR8394123.1 mandelate racemase/muconate lactonizing enzyme family protein [Aliifodinibius sp. S!AR15-10]